MIYLSLFQREQEEEFNAQYSKESSVFLPHLGIILLSLVSLLTFYFMARYITVTILSPLEVYLIVMIELIPNSTFIRQNLKSSGMKSCGEYATKKEIFCPNVPQIFQKVFSKVKYFQSTLFKDI